ncbi:cell division site-positioning protein MapZ family protein [Streptococcus respiraculi]|uniref:cell division site-positioning protein MapZ family protein n=1 Tax=Streptococcus respiraculi TaxID=2021971 RepID=UPI000E73B950|nr:cell division site-positioning protein MapZ family protein [Streptococcus respiraculi]
MVKNTEKSNNLPDDGEKILEFEDAKNMTVGQAVRKHEEIQAGVTEEDGLLDRYIKQHRDEIESKKYETQVNLPVVTDEDVAETEEVEEAEEVSEVNDSSLEPTVEEQVDALPLHKLAPETSKEEVLPDPETAPFNDFEEEEKPSRKPMVIWIALALFFITALALAFVWMKQSEKAEEATSSSTSTSQSSSSSKEDATLTAFNSLYATFFVDKEQSKLKNSEFAKLPELKKALDKIDKKASAYQTAKKKYDSLETAIKSVQALNNQFDKPILVNGDLDTTATVKDGETLTPATTGIAAVDAKITAAINLGRSQQTTASSVAPAPNTGTNAGAQVAATEAPVSADQMDPSVQTGGDSVGTDPLYGIAIPAGVTLQRNLSRVPYDQTKIDDVNNPAWTFNPGVLEAIIAVSQERGYVIGYNYILEPVNIINGNGYYNLFRPDGTYLFSMNAKTGYFVGNGAGYADDLDY